MLVELEIHNLALIRSARIRLHSGLNVLTGETGAGKTLVLRALALVLGARAERGQVRDGAGEARVAALFALAAGERARLAGRLPELRLDPADEPQLLLERTVGADGRSRAYLNGELCPIQTLRQLGDLLRDGVGQGEARLLAEREHRTRLLDLFGGHDAAWRDYAAARQRALAARDRRDRLHEQRRERRRRIEFLRHEHGAIAAARLEPGETARLEQELALLESARDLDELCRSAILELYEGDDAAVDRLGRFARRLNGLGEAARAVLEPAARAFADAAERIAEGVRELEHALDRIPTDPRRGAEVAERLDVLRHLLDRFGPGEEDVLRHRDHAAAELARLEQEESDTDLMDAAAERAAGELVELGRALDLRRGRAAGRLARALQEGLAALGMEGAGLAIRLLENPGDDPLERADALGLSRVEFLLQANRGLAPRPIAEVASGGEAARIALALRAALAPVLDTPLVVFDEVEAGVGARLGEPVARVLRDIAARRQVLVVTHLPQVAAHADHHLFAAKQARGGSTEVQVVVLEGERREQEIAAMMRGGSARRSTRGEARSLLKEAQAGEDEP